MLVLLRLLGVLSRTAESRSTHYSKIADGTMVPPISIGERAAAYPEHEVEAIIAARIAGRSNEEIKELVLRLIAQRSQADAGMKQQPTTTSKTDSASAPAAREAA
jgi:prophage regulatory protein